MTAPDQPDNSADLRKVSAPDPLPTIRTLQTMYATLGVHGMPDQREVYAQVAEDLAKVLGSAEHAHKPNEQAGEQALRDQVRDVFHSIAPGCLEYHAADCQPCTARAEALMTAVVQPAIDAKDAEIKRLNALRDELLGDIAKGVQVATGWRNHAQAAEAVAGDVSAKAGLLRLDLAAAIKRAEAAEAEIARLIAELAQARADLGRYDHYAVQIGAKELDT